MRSSNKQRGNFSSRIEQGAAGPARGNRAVILVGQGNLWPGAGAGMIRLAERAQGAGTAPLVTACFLNHRRPTIAEAVARCVERGAGELVLQPYFLGVGRFVRQDLERALEQERAAHPSASLLVARPFGDHPALARLVLKRALEADYLAAHPHIESWSGPRPLDEGAAWQPLHTRHRTGLLIMSHGSGDPSSVAAVQSVARQVLANGRYASVEVGFLDQERSNISDAVLALARRGITHMVAVPYLLHLGGPVREELPRLLAAARQRLPHTTIILSQHLGYDRLLVSVITDRVAEALRSGGRPAPAESLGDWA